MCVIRKGYLRAPPRGRPGLEHNESLIKAGIAGHGDVWTMLCNSAWCTSQQLARLLVGNANKEAIPGRPKFPFHLVTRDAARELLLLVGRKNLL
jgi:hypothetical protein